MASREAMTEALDKIECGMNTIETTRDIWQNDVIYALCYSVRLMLIDKLKEHANGGD